MTMQMEKCKELAPGVFQRSKLMYFLKCTVKGTYHIFTKARIDALVAKYGSLEEVGKKYVSRDARTESKDAAKEARRVAREAKKAAKLAATPAPVPVPVPASVK